MKIAMIGLRGIPAKSGGVEVVVDHLAPLLVKLGADVTVYCRNQYCDRRPKEYKGVKLKYLPTINTMYTEALTHTFLSSMSAIFSDYDIVHYHAMGNGPLSFMPKISGKKTVITLHGLDYERDKWGKIAKIYLKASERIITSFPDKIISVSKKIKRHYEKNYHKKVAFIPNGVDIEKPIPLDYLKKYNIKKDNYILFLSRIVPEKGLHYLIKAFSKIETDMKLLVVGEDTHTGEYLKKVKALAEKDKRIIFTGPLYGNPKKEAFSNAAFFVLPSTIEGMPIVLLEAMSYGLCPLVSNIKENIEVVGDNAVSFISRDEKDLEKKLRYMIDNKEIRNNKGKVCKKIVEKDYQWKKIAKQTFDIYTGLLQGKDT